MKRYRGKNAVWFILLFILFNVLPLTIFMKQNVVLDTLLVGVFVFYNLFDFIFIKIIVRNYIELYDAYFLFYYGFCKRKVWLNDIKRIEKSRDMTASSANSLDRIYIETKQDEFMVSLKKNDEFIAEVRKRMRNC